MIGRKSLSTLTFPKHGKSPRRTVIAFAAVLAAAVPTSVALATAPPAFAEAEYYHCSFCENISGADLIDIRKNWARNASGYGVQSTVWQAEGEGKYNRAGYNYTTTGTEVIAEAGSIITGHGDVRRWYEHLYALEGEEALGFGA
jgi:hypothetical protein